MSNKVAFPILINLCRAGQSAVWEASDPGAADQRIRALEDDASIVWFYAYDVQTAKVRAVKRTAIEISRPENEIVSG